MTPAQQRVYLREEDKDFKSDSDTMTFADHKSFLEWQRKQNDGR